MADTRKMSSHPSAFARRSFRQGVITVLVGVSLAAWALVVGRMRGMDAGPGTDLGSLGWYLGIWVTMMAAMMLPSAMPMVLFFSKVSEQSSRRPGLATALFVIGYLIAWTAYGLVAFAIFRLVRDLDPCLPRLGPGRPEIAGAAIVLAGIYQLTPLKRVCLRTAARRSASSCTTGATAPAARCAWASSTVAGASAAAGR